jgi:hypothetical protein
MPCPGRPGRASPLAPFRHLGRGAYVVRLVEAMRIQVECNASMPSDLDSKVHDGPDRMWDSSHNFGASLNAFENSGRQLGYTPAGCGFTGLTASVRNDLVGDRFADPSRRRTTTGRRVMCTPMAAGARRDPGSHAADERVGGRHRWADVGRPRGIPMMHAPREESTRSGAGRRADPSTKSRPGQPSAAVAGSGGRLAAVLRRDLRLLQWDIPEGTKCRAMRHLAGRRRGDDLGSALLCDGGAVLARTPG